MSPEEAVRHALDGNAVLFIGAGFSWGARNIEDDPIPAGKALAIHLLAEIGYPASDLPLDKATAAYLRRKDASDLIALLTPKLTVKEVSLSHQIISALPFRRVYTTNYDDFYEQARRVQGLNYSQAEGIDNPRHFINRDNLVIHINGMIGRLDETKLFKSFKLASGSYAADSFDSSGWAFHFRNDLRAARAVIFIGYSMYDLDIRRTVYEEDMSDRCVFITAPLTSDNELDAEDLSDLGVLAPIGIDAFADQVHAIVIEYVPQEPELLLSSWSSLDPLTSQAASPTDQEVIDFLLFGEMSESLLAEASGSQRDKFAISRNVFFPALEDIKNGLPVVLVGDLGTGKSFLVGLLARFLVRDGLRVYQLSGSASVVEEAIGICATDGRKLFIIENYQRYMDLLKWFSDARPQDASLLMTARPSAHDLFQADLIDLFSSRLRLHDVSRLDRHEVDGLADILNHYGLWGDRSAWNIARKTNYIKVDCSSELPSVLVDVLKSQHITKRYRDLLSGSHNRQDVEKVLICVFALSVMSFTPTIPKIQELLANSVNWAGLRSQTYLQSVVAFDSNQVRVRSSVLATHLLHEAFDARQVIFVLIVMVKQADARRTDRDYSLILNEMMRYGNVSKIVPEKKRLESTISFYEGVKNLNSAKRNPQFWLQYAIACLALGRLERSGRYFDTSYSLASAVDSYDTSKIDNHYARYLLEIALAENNLEDGKRNLDKAVNIILQQMGDEIKFYPYRVAGNIFKFYDKHKAQLSPADKSSFMRTFSQIHKRASSTRETLRDNKYVVECLRHADAALMELSLRC